MITIKSFTQNPITKMGEYAGICTDFTNADKFYNVGKSCIKSGHGRVLEYPDVIMEIDGYSSRVIRELYTHILGITRLQESTRYVDCENFSFYTPDTLSHNKEAFEVYNNLMNGIKSAYKILTVDYKVPKEDVANILPLGMNTKIVLKINLRALFHMFEERLCNRAYKEFRKLMTEMKYELSKLDKEWNELTTMMNCKCDKEKLCRERRGSCGKYPNA